MIRLSILFLILSLFFAGCTTLPSVKKDPVSGVPQAGEVRVADVHLASASPDLTTIEDGLSNAEEKTQKEAEKAYSSANEFYLQGDKDRSIGLYRRALSLNPDHKEAQEMLGRTLNEKLEEVRLVAADKGETQEKSAATGDEEHQVGERAPVDKLEEDRTETPPQEASSQVEMREAFTDLGEDLHIILPTDPKVGEWKASVHDHTVIDIIGVLYAPPIPGSPAGTLGNVVYALRSKRMGKVNVSFRFGSGSFITKKINYTINVGGSESEGLAGGLSPLDQKGEGNKDGWDGLLKEQERLAWEKRENEVRSLEETVEQRRQKLAAREDELLKQETEIAKRERELAARELAVERKDQEVARRESQVFETSLRLKAELEKIKLDRAAFTNGTASLKDRNRRSPLPSTYQGSQGMVERESLNQFNLGMDLLKEKMYEESLPELNAAIQDSEDERLKEGASLAIGLALSGQGQNDEAIDQYRSLLDEFPEGKLRGQTQLQLAKTLLEQSDHQGAIVEFKRAIISYPGEVDIQSEALLGLADSYRGAGEIELALKSSEDLLDRFPDSPIAADAQFMIGDIYDRNLGVRNFHKAVRAYRRLVERYRSSRWVERARDRIEHIEKNYL